jgi:hypothetical protein
MANTGGFEVVAEITKPVVDEILRAARKSNVIPQGFTDTDPIAFGPYLTRRVEVVVPEAGLGCELLPATNSVRVNVPVEIDVEIQNPPVPSTSLFEMTADLRIDAPLGPIPGEEPKVGVLTRGIGPSQVGATVTSGDPIPPITESLIAEYVHARWEAETVPHVVQLSGVSHGGRTFDVHFQTFDDETDASKRITVSVVGTQVTVSIPCALQLSNITGVSPLPPSPLAVVARLELVTQLDVQPGRVRTDLGAATVTVTDLGPGAGLGGANYSAVSGFVGPLIETQLRLRATAVAQAVGVISVDVPTVAQLERFIADQLHARVAAQPDIGIWTPDLSSNDIDVRDAVPKVLADVVAVAINSTPGADVTWIDDFVPAGAGFAVALDGDKVIALVREQRDKPEDDGGLGGIPQRREVEGKQVDIHRLDFHLRTGAIRGEGDVTVIDAVAGSIDVDASFWADIGLRWKDADDGGQELEPFVIDDDVSLSAGAWIVMVILGFVIGGLIIGIVLLVVYLVVEGIAESVGSSVIDDETTGQVRMLGAWPSTLDGIGDVRSRFENPVVIEPDAIVFAGSITVTSTHALTASAPPISNGPYLAVARQPFALSAGAPVLATAYQWRFADGTMASGTDTMFEHSHSGTYVTRLGTTVNQPGGVSLGDLTVVKVRNVAPSATITAPTEVDEGEQFDVVVDLTDPEWLDTHEVIVDFGDDTLPALPAVTETNSPPQAVGRAVAGHAYCDSGQRTITAQVIDVNGGVTVVTHDVVVHNVAPTVTAPERIFAYHCSALTLIAPFTDPGWCDTHRGTWDFGDCSPVIDATIRQLHEPPMGVGYAAATHCYDRCGRFEARVVVVDDDGGVGADTTIVEVIDIGNRRFEAGFRRLIEGEVANEWEPVGDGELRADHTVVRHGRAAQAFRSREAAAGIRQRIGANPGWDYQVTAHCHRPGGGARMAVGIHPRGGDDPVDADVVWMRAAAADAWRSITVRATAAADTDAITLFVMNAPDPAGADRFDLDAGYVDEVELLAIPCPLPKVRRPKDPAPPGRTCVDWRGEKAPQQLGEATERGGVGFAAVAGGLRLVGVGDVVGLMLPQRGLRVTLPGPTGEVRVRLAVFGSADVTLAVVDSDGSIVATESSGDADGPERVVRIDAQGRNEALVVVRSGAEVVLVELCHASARDARPSVPPSSGVRPGEPTDARRDHQRPRSTSTTTSTTASNRTTT